MDMRDIIAHDGWDSDFVELRASIERLEKMMDDLIESRDEAYKALLKMYDIGWHDTIVYDFEDKFIEVAHKIDELKYLIEQFVEHISSILEMVHKYLDVLLEKPF